MPGRKGNMSMRAEIETTTALAAVTKALARKYVSPLRYPGGKRKLVTHVASALDHHGMPKIDRVIEPFTGGQRCRSPLWRREWLEKQF